MSGAEGGARFGSVDDGYDLNFTNPGPPKRLPSRQPSGGATVQPPEGLLNRAFVFIKPHAVSEGTINLAKEAFSVAGLTVVSEGRLGAEEIDSKRLIDRHYYAIASKATILKPKELKVPADKFEAEFGLSWEAALFQGNVYNAMDACEMLGIGAAEMEARWRAAEKAGHVVKFGGGFYCGLLEAGPGKPPVYVFNGFFMAMRAKYTSPGAAIHHFTVEWDEGDLSWSDLFFPYFRIQNIDYQFMNAYLYTYPVPCKICRSDFRGQFIGATDPSDAPDVSMRGQIRDRWRELGLSAPPDTGDNGVHASASPFEALAERVNWCGVPLGQVSITLGDFSVSTTFIYVVGRC